MSWAADNPEKYDELERTAVTNKLKREMGG